MADTTGVLARLQAALSVYDPTWDVSVGSATYKILEAVAQEIANANNNSILQTYSYDISTKSGNDLDNFCNLFGVYRQYGKRSVGVVTFKTSTAATSIIDIPIGTQVAVPVGGSFTIPIYYSTTAPAIIPVGSSSVDVPIIATLPGANGNIPSNVISTIVSSLNGITSVNNNNITNGGLDPESDSALRSRWQNTAFNNTTGTNGKYIMTALQNPNVSSANAFGQQNFYDENISVQATISGGNTNGVTFQLIAYSGMTNVISGTVYSSTNVVTYSGFTASTSGAVLQSGLQNMFNSVAPNNNIGVTVTPIGNTISGGLNIALSLASPYRLSIGSGNAIAGTSVNSSGTITISGTSYTEYMRSLNPDIGASGTLSVNQTYSGYLFPQGNELIGSNLNTASQKVYAPITDYFLTTTGTTTITGTQSPQAYVKIVNGSNSTGLFIGNYVELITEYNPASSRSLTLTSGNYIDIFINGTTADSATSQAAFIPSSAMTLTSGNALKYLNTMNYVLGSGSYANTNANVANDYYVALDRQPVINYPSQIGVVGSGIADTLYLYNPSNGSGYNYPIALNPYPYITFTGSIASLSGTASGTSNYFVSVPNASNFIFPGIALASGTATSGSLFYVWSSTSSGIYMNAPVTATGNAIVMSGKALVYPLYDITSTANSVLSMNGIAFDATTPPVGWPSLPTSNAIVTYVHDYNSDVVDVDALINQSRPIGVNTLVHQATFINLNINVRIVLSAGVSLPTVQSNISNILTSYFATTGYLSVISFANLQTQILGVSGVVNVKVTSVSNVATDGTILNTFTSDFILASNQLPQLNSVGYTVVGASSF